MPSGSVWDEILDTKHVNVVRTYIERWHRKNREPEKVLVVVVEPDKEARNRCPECGIKGVPVESDVRRWRTLDVHGKRCFLESAIPRIECAEHGKITASVPWARHDDRFTMPFEEHAAWMAAQMAWTKVSAELRITWEAVVSIVARVSADAAATLGRPGDLTMIGIDKKSWGKGSDKFLTVVTDHVTGKIAWICEGRSQDTVRAFSTPAFSCPVSSRARISSRPFRFPCRRAASSPAAPNRRTVLIAADASQAAWFSSRCVLSGVRSPQNQAIAHPLRSGRSLASAARYFPAWASVSARLNTGRSSPRSSSRFRFATGRLCWHPQPPSSSVCAHSEVPRSHTYTPYENRKLR